jgi:outer membrane lipoprotein SlyB
MNPSTFENAAVEGHISKLNRSGRMTGRTELALEFDTITMNGQSAPFRAELIRIYDSEKVKQIDEEGNIETSSRTSDTTKRTTIGAVAGAVLGGIAGGGKGAAIGAIIGAGAGAGTVLIEGNKDLRLEQGTEILVRTEGRR